jgi:hypothetical protein
VSDISKPATDHTDETLRKNFSDFVFFSPCEYAKIHGQLMFAALPP